MFGISEKGRNIVRKICHSETTTRILREKQKKTKESCGRRLKKAEIIVELLYCVYDLSALKAYGEI